MIFRFVSRSRKKNGSGPGPGSKIWAWNETNHQVTFEFLEKQVLGDLKMPIEPTSRPVRTEDNKPIGSSVPGWARLGCICLASCIAGEVSADWVTGMTIRNVRTMASTGEVTFATSEPIMNPSNCVDSGFYVISDNPKQALAILLASQASGLKVSFYIPPGSAGCASIGRPRVTDVLIGNF